MIPSTKQFENIVGSQTRQRNAMLPRNSSFPVVFLVIVDKLSGDDDDDDDDLDLANVDVDVDVEVSDFPFERKERVSMRRDIEWTGIAVISIQYW